MADKFSNEQRSKIMSAIRSTGTKPELLLCKALYSQGHRYRKNSKKIYGRPDISFSKHKLAIFIDSEFFHGFEWDRAKDKILSNRDYWIPKIERNMRRDKDVNEVLISLGWKVIRFWSKAVMKDVDSCLAVIERELPPKDIDNPK
jgi:DNA mismatch endonuclease (patch repair protein)